MPPKPAMMAAWLGKAKEGEFGTVIHSPAALATLNDMRQSGQVQRSSLPLVFSSICQSTKVVVVQVLIVRRGNSAMVNNVCGEARKREGDISVTGLVGRRNWDAKRKRSVRKGVGG